MQEQTKVTATINDAIIWREIPYRVGIDDCIIQTERVPVTVYFLQRHIKVNGVPVKCLVMEGFNVWCYRSRQEMEDMETETMEVCTVGSTRSIDKRELREILSLAKLAIVSNSQNGAKCA